jgi:Sec-independent protein translocase protein TatA
MLNLDPSKLLVIAVVAVILLGPERLPAFARQVGGAWRSFTEYRHRMEAQVRSSMPDLPTSAEIARLARSPGALLDRLSSMSPETEGTEAPLESRPPVPEDGKPIEKVKEVMTRGFAPPPAAPVRVPPTAPTSPADPGLN